MTTETPQNRSFHITDCVVFTLLIAISLLRGMFFSTFNVVWPLTQFHNEYHLILYALIVICLFLILHRTQSLSQIPSALKNLWPALPFVTLTLLSQLWTIDKTATMVRALLVLIAFLLAAMLRARYPLDKLLQKLVVAAAALTLVSLLPVILLPEQGIMWTHAYTGNWRGIFWHKNHLGTTSSVFNLILLFGVLNQMAPRIWSRAILISAYVFSWLLLFASQSATGIISTLIIHLMVLGIVTWQRIGKSLRRSLQIPLLIGFTGSVLAALLNLNPLLALFGRNTTLTGRIPMWNILLSEYVIHRPFLGYGFGAFWNQAENWLNLQSITGWYYPVLIGDNGLMDTLLHLGLLGCISVGLFFGVYFWWALDIIRKEHSMLSIFPLMLGILALLLNTTYSMFFEMDEFLGLLLFACLPFPADGSSGSAATIGQDDASRKRS